VSPNNRGDGRERFLPLLSPPLLSRSAAESAVPFSPTRLTRGQRPFFFSYGVFLIDEKVPPFLFPFPLLLCGRAILPRHALFFFRPPLMLEKRVGLKPPFFRRSLTRRLSLSSKQHSPPPFFLFSPCLGGLKHQESLFPLPLFRPRDVEGLRAPVPFFSRRISSAGPMRTDFSPPLLPGPYAANNCLRR